MKIWKHFHRQKRIHHHKCIINVQTLNLNCIHTHEQEMVHAHNNTPDDDIVFLHFRYISVEWIPDTVFNVFICLQTQKQVWFNSFFLYLVFVEGQIFVCIFFFYIFNSFFVCSFGQGIASILAQSWYSADE